MAFVLTLMYVATTLLSPGVFPNGAASLHIPLVLGLMIIVSAIPSIESSKITHVPDAYLAAALLFATAFSTLATGWISGTLGTFLDFVPIIMTFYFVAITCGSLKRLKLLVFVMMCVGLFIVAKGILAEASGVYPHPYLIGEGVDGGVLYRHRGLGVLSDPNDLAQFLTMIIPMLFLWWKPGSTFRNIIFTLVPVSILLLGIFFTHSRGGTLAVVAVLLFGFKDKLGVIKSTIIAGIGMAGFLLLNVGGGRGIGDDDGGRVAFWATGLQSLKRHPIFGIGYGNISDILGGRTSHNSYILGMVELGFFGYFFWMAMLVSSWGSLSTLIGLKPKVEAPDDSMPSIPPRREPAPLREPRAKKIRMPATAYLQPATQTAGFAARSGSLDDSSSSSLPSAPGKWSSIIRPGQSMEEEDDTVNPAELARAADIVRTGLVGFLAAAMFLSRTYSVPLYIAIGMGVCLVNLSPTRVSMSTSALIKWTLIVMFASVIVMYIVVLAHGGK